MISSSESFILLGLLYMWIIEEKSRSPSGTQLHLKGRDFVFCAQ